MYPTLWHICNFQLSFNTLTAQGRETNAFNTCGHVAAMDHGGSFPPSCVTIVLWAVKRPPDAHILIGTGLHFPNAVLTHFSGKPVLILTRPVS